MSEKLQTCQNSDRRKELRSEINLSLSFKESLNEKLLDLQDANDVLSTNFKKMKLFKRDKAELRKEILAIQNNRQDIALEQDDVQAEFEAEKARVDARNTLSENMFNIEAAIRSGREKARKEGRDDEGPAIPLGMLLDTVGRDVGSHGGGLLANVKSFNGLLERAAGWLEGRA
jgi:DNA-dependent RNA polymerase auxiliary subunit epsilon